MIKELKDGKVREKLRFATGGGCISFEVVGKRIMTVRFGYKIAVYENGQLIKTCGHEWGNKHSVFVGNSKAYFPCKSYDLIEWNLETFQERLLMLDVTAISGLPSKPNFAAISKDGLLQTKQSKKELKEVFPKVKSFYWCAVISAGRFAVVAGHSEYTLPTGEKLATHHNFFLLVDLTNLEVMNQENPLALQWLGKGDSIV